MSKDKRIKQMDGFSQIFLDLTPKRNDSVVYINEKIDVTNLVDYVNNMKKKGERITYFHTFLTALGKTMYNRPRLNYYVKNRHLYEHKDIKISFVAKIEFDDKSEEVMLEVPIKHNDNIFTISKKTNEYIDKIRNKSKVKNISTVDKTINLLSKLPNIIRIPIIGLFKLIDKLNILPETFKEGNIYYSSMLVSNLGSIKCDAIYHHLTEFGTCSSVVTIGEIKDEEIYKNGKKEIRKIVEIGANLDERIADGYYFIKCMKLIEFIFANPTLLENGASELIKVEEIH